MHRIITALLIDPAKASANFINFMPELDEYYSLLNCDQISSAYLFHDLEVATTIVEAMPHTFHDPKLGGIPCTISKGWQVPVCGPIIVSGPPDEEGECTSINTRDAAQILKDLAPALLRVINGRPKYQLRARSYPIPFDASKN